MSASEKLKLLGDPDATDSPAAKLGAGLLLIDALPQIVAVVEAAEITWSNESPGGGGAYGAREGLDALAALDEALS